MQPILFLSSAFVLNAVIVFFALLLLFPLLSAFISQMSADLYTFLYMDYFEAVMVLFSLAVGMTLSYSLRHMHAENRIKFLVFQAIFLISLAAVFYLNIDTLSDMFSRPSYE